MNFSGKVLIADDEAHIRKFVGLILRRLGTPTVIEAVNGRNAVDLFTAERPDLVMLDVNMPVLDGVRALAEIAALDPAVPVIMLTSLTNRQTVEECARLGAVDYIRKDTPRDEIHARLQEIIAETLGQDAPADAGSA